jgi:hypothetical protein
METVTGTVIMGMSSNDELLKWVNGLTSVLTKCSPPPKLPSGVETDATWNPVDSFGNSGGDTYHHTTLFLFFSFSWDNVV